jgi:thiol-disulfide isomerase/thioredoxin
VIIIIACTSRGSVLHSRLLLGVRELAMSATTSTTSLRPIFTPADLAALVRGKEALPDELKSVADQLADAYQGQVAPEAVRMFIALASGSKMTGESGWFGPAQSRFNWTTLAKRHGVDLQGGITADAFQGKPEWFARLDRNRDGVITAEDLDWSEANSWVQHAYPVNRLLRRLDKKGSGRLTREEWLTFFDSVADDSGEATLEGLREAWLAGISAVYFPGDAPTQERLLKGMLNGELGAFDEGPRLNEQAPDFTLQTLDGQTVQLSDRIGVKPVVLMFGNFTCAPFRSMYPGVDDVYRRFRDQADFLGVYVREAHPTDGWKMESNTRLGVAVSQPTSNDERRAVAQQCCRLLQPSFPWLVDEIDDPVGNAYSGMPARLYVLDSAGKVAYQGGRGPFGFSVGEMEQALVMTFLDEQTHK